MDIRTIFDAQNSLAFLQRLAIENARLYTRTEIYASVLERQLGTSMPPETALTQAKGEQRISDDRFQKVFHSSPVAFSITTYKEGQFLDVERGFRTAIRLFPRRTRSGHTVDQLRIWEDPADRAYMLAQLQRGGPLRNLVTRLRAKSGEIKVTAYSADKIEFDGQTCILAVSEDLPQCDPGKSN